MGGQSGTIRKVPQVPNPHLKKEAFLAAYKKTYGNVSESCKIIKLDRRTYYNWVNEDPEFKAALEAVRPDDLIVDYAERSLMKNIRYREVASTLFALKTKGRKRGWQEKQSIDLTSNEKELTALTMPEIEKKLSLLTQKTDEPTKP